MAALKFYLNYFSDLSNNGMNRRETVKVSLYKLNSSIPREEFARLVHENNLCLQFQLVSDSEVPRVHFYDSLCRQMHSNVFSPLSGVPHGCKKILPLFLGIVLW